MSHKFGPRSAVVLIVFLGVLGTLSEWVDAHATFIGPQTVAASTRTSLVMNVPNERDDTTFNVEVAIRLPDGWSGLGCRTKPSWTCSIGSEFGHAVVRFRKDVGAAQAEDETFGFTVLTGTATGTVSFPTAQTYNTGETVSWIDGPNSAEPAPSLQVTEAPTTATTDAPNVSNTLTTKPQSSAAATTTPTAAVIASTTSTVATTELNAIATSTSAASTQSSEISVLPSSNTADSSVPAQQPGTSGSSKGGHNTLVVAIVLVAVGSAAGALGLRRRRAVTRGTVTHDNGIPAE
jgi:hypothetical protein